MNENTKFDVELEAPDSKRPYEPPVLSEYGSVEELTKGTGLLLTDGTVVSGSVIQHLIG